MSDKAEDFPEAGSDPQTADIIRWIGVVLWWIIWPIGAGIYYAVYYISFAVLFVVKLLAKPIAFVLAPILYLGQFILACLVAPFQFIARFETIYIYLGVAALVGLTGGLFVTFISGSLQQLLGLDSRSEPSGRTAEEYRIEKQKQKAKAEAPLITSGYRSPGYFSLSDGGRKSRRRKDLLSQTIMEEVDSDY